MQQTQKWDIDQVGQLLDQVKCKLFYSPFHIMTGRDMLHKPGRLFIQLWYNAADVKNGIPKRWKSRKWYLSDYMTADEIIKTTFAAFRAAVEHEILEGFTVNGKILFNPHISVAALLTVCDEEVTREDKTDPA